MYECFVLPSHIALSDERFRQLENIAKLHRVTKAEAIGMLVNLAYENGLAPRELPGFEISVRDGVIHMQIEDLEDKRPAALVEFAALTAQIKQTLDAEGARAFAFKIQALLADSGSRPSFDLLQPFKTYRVGTGVAIESVLGRKRVVPRDVARDLSVLLLEAADQASRG